MKKILVVDDEEGARDIVRWTLESKGYRVTAAGGGDEALSALETDRPDLVLLDVMMPGMDGWEACRRIKERAGAFLPVVMLTSLSALKDKSEASARGADDFLSKPLQAEELLVKVSSMLRIKRDFDRLERVSVSDPLTGAHNRRHWTRRLGQCCDSALRGGPGFSCMILDLDKFKAINDVRGHAAGDDVLRRLGRRLRGSVRASDVLARYGGDEFTVLFPETLPGDARALSEKLLGVARETRFNGAPLSVSGGLCSFPAPDVRTQEALMQAADDALYQAKREGGDRLRVWEDDGGEAPGAEPKPAEAAGGLAAGPAEKPVAGTAVIVDDQQDLARLYQEALEGAGFRVLTALNGKEGIDMVLEIRPDLVVMDVMMPVMQGYDACRYLRERGDLGRTKVLMVSGKGADKDKEWAEGAGADAYLVKPVDLDELVRTARRLVGEIHG